MVVVDVVLNIAVAVLIKRKGESVFSCDQWNTIPLSRFDSL